MMNTNRTKLMYRISTVFLTLIMLFSIFNFIFNYENFSEVITNLGYPSAIIYPLAFAKILGLIAIWTRRSELLTTLAYAGFAIDTALATMAHIQANDGFFGLALAALLATVVSFFLGRRMLSTQALAVT